MVSALLWILGAGPWVVGILFVLGRFFVRPRPLLRGEIGKCEEPYGDIPGRWPS